MLLWLSNFATWKICEFNFTFDNKEFNCFEKTANLHKVSQSEQRQLCSTDVQSLGILEYENPVSFSVFTNLFLKTIILNKNLKISKFSEIEETQRPRARKSKETRRFVCIQENKNYTHIFVYPRMSLFSHILSEKKTISVSAFRYFAYFFLLQHINKNNESHK